MNYFMDFWGNEITCFGGFLRNGMGAMNRFVWRRGSV
jgi:hypothetical protein